MRRTVRTLSVILAALLGLVSLVLVAANTGPGRRALEWLAAWASGGEVRIVGLAGRFPDALRAQRLEVRDKSGPYVVVGDAAIDWSPTRLLRGVLAIDRLTAARVSVLRASAAGPAANTRPTDLPVTIAVTAMHIDRLTLAASIAGKQTVLTLDGSVALSSLAAGRLHVHASVPADGAAYTVDGAIGPAEIRLDTTLSEPSGGLMARLAGLPDIGPVTLKASLTGPRSALHVAVSLTAGEAHARATGQLDLDHQQADLTVEANAPAMHPGPDIAWRSIALNAHVLGSLSAPHATGRLNIEGLTAGTVAVDAVAAELSGNAGAATLRATLTGVRAPGLGGDMLAAKPMILEANARLDAPNRPVRFTIRHPMLTIAGTASIAGQFRSHLTLAVPDIAPMVAAFGGAARGALAMTMDVAQVAGALQASADGTMTFGGDVSTFHTAGNLRGQSVALTDGRIGTRFGTLTFAGTVAPGALSLSGTADLPDLATLRPDLAGSLRITASIDGPPDNLTVGADLSGSVATAGMKSGPLAARVDLHGLPTAPQGTATARGELLGAPVTLSIAARRQHDMIETVIEHADWNSAHAEGTIHFSTDGGNRAGSLHLTIARLADFAPLLALNLAGAASATLDLDGGHAKVGLTLRDAAIPGAASVARAELAASLDDLDARPKVDATLTVEGVRAGGIAASGTLLAKGTQDALALKLTASVPNLAGAPLTLSVGGTLDAVSRYLGLSALEAGWRHKSLRLLTPTRVDFANGIVLGSLRLGLDKAVLTVAGPVAPTLGLTATIRDLPASLAAMVAPNLILDGTIAGNARLSGNPARPEGTIKVDIVGLRLRQPLGRLLPPTRIAATATLAGGNARIDVRAEAGKSHATLTGQLPIDARGAMDLQATGLVDVGLIDPLLAANGSHVAGSLTVNVGIGGTISVPTLSGGATLANGTARNDLLGARLHAIAARLTFADGTLRIADMTARAGQGTIRVGGTVGLLAPGMPLDLTLTARDARPLASDALTVSLDADLTLRGTADALALGGMLRTRQVDFRVPDVMPAGVATIPVRDPDQPQAPSQAPPRAPLTIALDLALDAPNRVFVRGRGMDVELGGSVQLHGTLDRPQALGGLSLRRGTIAFAGQTLTFTQGTIGFDGASLVDPALTLVSTTNSNGVAATLTVGGTPRTPKITLTSVPELPQDEILAQLLFKRSVSSLSPLELAQIAAALASLTGLTPGIDNPLDRVRQSLGLDRLSVGTTKSGGAALEAGRFIAPGVYVGTKQGAGGGGEATVRIDLGKGLTLQGTTSTGGSTTGAGSESSGSSAGIGYEFEY